MSYTQHQENFFKLYKFVHLYGTDINRELLKKFIDLTEVTLEKFINDNQHEIYHFFCDLPCCQCKRNTVSYKCAKIIKNKQMLIIFDKESNRLDKHKQQRQRKLCCLKATKNVKLADLDLSLIRFFLVNFCFEVFWDCHLKYVKKTFSDFLDESVHKVYHLSANKIVCCKCNTDSDIPEKRISESQFEIIFKKEGSPCQAHCSCLYKINSDITLPLLIDRDKDLTTILTRYFCSCHKYLEDIVKIRNEIAHNFSDCSINDANFWQFWNTIEKSILGIATALNKHDVYDENLQELKKEYNNTCFQKQVVEWIKKSEHVTAEILAKITDLTERKVMAILENINPSTSNSGCVVSVADSLKDVAIAVRTRNTSESSAEYPGEMEVKFSVNIRNTCKREHSGDSQESEDDLLDKDKPTDIHICGRCKKDFTKLHQFSKHKEICNKKEKKTVERNPSRKIFYQMKITGAGKRWTTTSMNMFQSESEYFNTDKTEVCHLESSCLIVWAESSKSDFESEEKLKEHCIHFTQNMFRKCSLQSDKTSDINVTVKFSELFEESSYDDADHLECGKCGQVCLSINLFIAHKKECVRNRKRRRGNEQKESKGDIKSAPKSKHRRAVRISKEEENFLRIAVLIMRVATAAARIAFNKEFHRDALQRTLYEDPKVLVSLQRERIISQFDMQQIFRRSGLASSYSFSLKLMIWLIQYRTQSDVSRGLQDDPKHISIHAGLSRILNYKNIIIRMIDSKLQEDKLEEYWTDISKAIVRLGGEGFLQKCNNLKVSILDENYIEILTEIIEIAKSNDSNPQGFKRLLDNLFYIMPKTASPRTTPESNFIRIADLLLRNGPPAVRIIFNREFHPGVLQKELRKRTPRLAHLKGRGLINQAQWDKLFTRKDENKSKTFDLSLMICLIQNFTPIKVTDQLPRQDNKSEGADLSRLEYYRKQIAYSQECDLSVTVFEKYWTDITNAIVRIDGTMFLQRCQDLKMGKLDQQYRAILHEPNSSNILN